MHNRYQSVKRSYTYTYIYIYMIYVYEGLHLTPYRQKPKLADIISAEMVGRSKSQKCISTWSLKVREGSVKGNTKVQP